MVIDDRTDSIITDKMLNHFNMINHMSFVVLEEQLNTNVSSIKTSTIVLLTHFYYYIFKKSQLAEKISFSRSRFLTNDFKAID